MDILAGRIHCRTVCDTGDLRSVADYHVAGTVGAVAPVETDSGWILAAGQGFTHLGRNGSVRSLAQVVQAGTRMNDAACDPQGRLWAGTLADDFRVGGGALFRFDGDGQTELMLDDLTIANGLGWSPDGTTMYLADSGPRVVYAFAFDGREGTISDGRVLLSVDEEIGTPDGLTVDAEGDLWIAIYGGGRIKRYSPQGELRETLFLPAAQTTSCAFGGPGLNRLYVTTATEGWTDEERQAQPWAGLVYRLDTVAIGRAAEVFRPRPAWWTEVVSDPVVTTANSLDGRS